MPIDINTKAKCYFDTRPLTKGKEKSSKILFPYLNILIFSLEKKFFKRLIKQFPQYKPYFNETHLKIVRQPRSFHHCLLEFARNIDDLRPMKDFIMKLRQNMLQDKSVPISIEFWAGLVEVMMDQFEKFVDRICGSMDYGIWILANILINIEVREYQDKPWYGFKAFRVTIATRMCSTKSFSLPS